MNRDDLCQDDLCQECENRAEVMILCSSEYVDRFYCTTHAVEYLLDTNNDQHGYDEASAQAALDSMLIEGLAVQL